MLRAAALAVVVIAATCVWAEEPEKAMKTATAEGSERISLPEPSKRGRMSLEEALSARRSVREFRETPLTLAELSQLLWATQGITARDGGRTAPSAGALFPLEVYVAIPQGLYSYEVRHHRLVRHVAGDLRGAIHAAAVAQDCVREAPAVFVLAAAHERTARKYGTSRTPRYVAMEAGHAAQNLLLEAVALGLGAVPVGAFEDARLKKVLSLPADQEPLYLVPVGHPR